MHEYEIAIIGAGINGASLAYSLQQAGKNVIVFEQDAIASGGSGAAGAFINPKISKAGELKELIEEAYVYSLDFYVKHFNKHTTTAPLLHISKYEDDNAKVEYFKEHTQFRTSKMPSYLKERLTEHALSFSSVLLKDNAIVEANDICEEMLEGVDLVYEKVLKPVYKDGFWHINKIKAKKIVLCTGAYEEIFKEDHIALRRIYGQRCEVKSSTFMPATLHHHISISATKKNGAIAIGASHYLNEEEMPSGEEGAQQLLELANKSLVLEDIQVQNVLTGMRAGSNDYLPLLGPLVDTSKSLALDERALEGNKKAELVYHKEVYMMNGVGGYGFVLAPYLASLLSQYLVNAKALPEYLEPKRFYYRYTKKLGHA